MPVVKLTLAYDGTAYAGWQVQPNQPTVQATMEEAVFRLTGMRSQVLSAGRTDAGVHALGQVASFYTTATIPGPNWRPALQNHLPYDVVVRESSIAPDNFHATFSAIRKRYRYVIHNGPVCLPFLRNHVHHVRAPLSAEAMHRAGQQLVGRHDFRSFETDWPNKVTSVRTVEEITIRRGKDWNLWANNVDEPPKPDEAGEFLHMDIVADGFLYNMVRSIMGTLLHVGRGAWAEDRIAAVLAAQDRTVAGNTAPACGLYLVKVDYE
jgi:tRNA pseudouridine38-40 synthase